MGHPLGPREAAIAEDRALLIEKLGDEQIAQAVLDSGVLDQAEDRGALLAAHLIMVLLDGKPETEPGAATASAFHMALESGGWNYVGTLFPELEF